MSNMDEKYKDKPWYGKVKLAGRAIEVYESLSPEEQAKYDEALMEIANNPYRGELAKPCASCGEHFWYSDGQCPYCGWRVLH